jgi:hypothetical protein
MQTQLEIPEFEFGITEAVKNRSEKREKGDVVVIDETGRAKRGESGVRSITAKSMSSMSLST